MIRHDFKTSFGAATLVFTIILFTVATLIILFATNINRLQTKSTDNVHKSYQAFEAAQAGLEYGISYLKANAATIIANPVGGYIVPFSNSNTSNVALSDGSSYTITYTNPVQNNYYLIKVSSVGTASDGSTTKTVSILIQINAVVVNIPANPLTSQGAINLNDNATVKNLSSNTTIRTGGAASLSNNAQTILQSGTSSTQSVIKSDIQQNLSSLSGMTASDFFTGFFGADAAAIKSAANVYYSSSTNRDYSSQLNGVTNSVIWIDQTSGSTATIQNNRTLGSPTNPVVLIVNGKLTIQDNVTIYGFVFVTGATSTSQNNVTINGAMASTNNMTLQNNFTLNYNSTILNKLKTQSNTSIYAKVPGSWRDF